ncbi:hypothetical protein LIER_18976 [Lithospermum erythrorhizon]|uniref:Uncharacterized protein n=1 Tax=Lithospermum erythrorhizon TaxID=34254 RepID=A0AAV3QH76_LITER
MRTSTSIYTPLLVHVHKSKRVIEAVLNELSLLLFKFNETFDGVVLAYDPSNWCSNARVLPGIHPFLGVGLSAKLLLFSPKTNMFVAK